MKSRKFLLFLLIAGINFNNVFSQSNFCICFHKDTKYIKYGVSKDSTLTSFGITNKGYETEAKRKKAFEDYRKRGPVNYPIFTTNYISGKPINIISINDVNCAIVVSVEDFRQQNFNYPPGVGSSVVYFIKKQSDDNFLVWKAFQLD